ncbi:hypothetical protein C8R45DRAFT_941574 [Mycena sanguinolenta]|nr:hypothetical protein C8R45DRAFT_941574 [Mycena sanguinolenta]
MGSSPELCGLSSLPNELLHAIAGHCRSEDLLNFCRASRRIHEISLGWIYRSIQLLDVAQVVKCCQTFIQSAHTAELVRSFEIACYPRFGLKAFYSTIQRAISRLKNVRILRISDSRTIFRLFSSLHFPHLSECAVPSAKSIVPFLQNHPTITFLHVLPSLEGLGSTHDLSAADAPFEFTSLLEPIHMSNLEAFVGPVNIACSVIPQSRACRMTIYWGSDPIMPFSEGLAILAQAKVDIIELNNLICHWDGALLSAIAEHIPRVQRLLFRNLLNFDDEETLDLLEGFHGGSDADALSDEFAIVRKWSSASPQLCHVGFPSNNTWGILCGAWFPGAATLGLIMFHGMKVDPRTMEQFKWFFRTTTTTPALPQDYHLLAEFIAGKEGIRAVREAIKNGGEVPDFIFTREDVNGSRIAFVSDASVSGPDTP